MNGLFSLLFIGIGMLAFAGIKHFWPGYPDDNKVEERAEQIIQLKTGKNIDLTPLSPEKAEEVKK